MANERTYPCLPCREIDVSIAFYESLGFKNTYRQALAQSSLAAAEQLELTDNEKTDLADEFAHVTELVSA